MYATHLHVWVWPLQLFASGNLQLFQGASTCSKGSGTLCDITKREVMTRVFCRRTCGLAAVRLTNVKEHADALAVIARPWLRHRRAKAVNTELTV